jgi:hypothetical protein
MSHESHSSACCIDSEEFDNSSVEFRLSEEDAELITTLNERCLYTKKQNGPVDINSTDIITVSEFTNQSRLVIDVTESGFYELQLYDNTPEAYHRNHLSSVFLNGKKFELRDGGLELFDVTVFIYKTQSNQYIASLWTQ